MLRKTALTLAALAGALLAQAAPIEVADTLHGSRVFPGTSHAYQIHIPDGCDTSQPAALYVGLDGPLCNAAAVIDSLIAAGKMPMTVAVFLQPGVIRAADGTVLRYNRSNEFDATTPRFAQFLEQELLPAVRRHAAITANPDLHMIFGLSSGGIAAFNAAWQRPDLFRRVFSGCGTFVSMRGGNDLQLWVRKGEPLPLKVFLQDGSNDAWNPLFGHWYEGNRMLASALDFAGYNASYDWDDSGHSVRRASQIFAQVMEWMWAGWQQPLAAGTSQNDAIAATLVPGSQWEPRPWQGGAHATATRMAVYPDSSHVALAAAGSNTLQQALLGGGTLAHAQPFYHLHSQDNSLLDLGGMAFDSNGNLWVVTSAGLQMLDQNGRVRAIYRLPQGLGVASTHIAIAPGSIMLTDAAQRQCWQRPFAVQPPAPGVRPKSQGQG